MCKFITDPVEMTLLLSSNPSFFIVLPGLERERALLGLIFFFFILNIRNFWLNLPICTWFFFSLSNASLLKTTGDWLLVHGQSEKSATPKSRRCFHLLMVSKTLSSHFHVVCLGSCITVTNNGGCTCKAIETKTKLVIWLTSFRSYS